MLIRGLLIIYSCLKIHLTKKLIRIYLACLSWRQSKQYGFDTIFSANTLLNYFWIRQYAKIIMPCLDAKYLHQNCKAPKIQNYEEICAFLCCRHTCVCQNKKCAKVPLFCILGILFRLPPTYVLVVLLIYKEQVSCTASGL